MSVTCSIHGKVRNSYKILVRKDQVGDTDIHEKIIKNEISECVKLFEDRVPLQTILKEVMNLWVS